MPGALIVLATSRTYKVKLCWEKEQSAIEIGGVTCDKKGSSVDLVFFATKGFWTGTLNT